MPSPAVSCPRGQGFPPRTGGPRLHAADPSGDPLGRRAGIPELAPERACGRGGEGRGGEFPPLGGRAAAATRSCPRGRPGTPASSAPAGSPHSRLGRSGLPGAPRSHRVGLGGQRNAGPRPPVTFQSPRQKPGSWKRRETKGRWGGSPHTPSHPPRPTRPLLIVAEDLVGDFTVENFLVGPQVRGRLLAHKRLSV